MTLYAKSPNLTREELETIVEILTRFDSIKAAILFGSRAKGTHKPGSDIDIALIGSNLRDHITQISSQLNEETYLPYFFDLVDYATITNQSLKEHIDRVGIQFYTACLE